MSDPVYQRILLKLSGEALAGEKGSGVDAKIALRIAEEVREVHDLGVQVGIVLGGGNIIRGISASAHGLERVVGDKMGMLATIINSLALQGALERVKVDTRLMTALEMRQIAEPFIRRRAVRHLEKRRVVIFAGGIGNPYFSTDTAAALRAMEIKADVILKATKVDGVYDADPVEVPDARMYTQVSYLDLLSKGLSIMDTTAVSLCMDNRLPIIVFNFNVAGNIRRVVMGEKIGSMVSV